MSVPNALTVENLFSRLQHDFLRSIRVSKHDTTSSSIRPLSGFDAHLHPNFRLKSLAYDPEMLTHALLSLRKALVAQPEFPSMSDISTWSNALLHVTSVGIRSEIIRNEDSIFLVINTLLKAAGQIATKCFTWDSDVANLYPVCSGKSGSSIADILVCTDTSAPQSLSPAILSLFSKLDEADVLISSHLKHYLLLHPGHILFLYVFIYAIEKAKVTQSDLLFPWPVSSRCGGCQKYQWAHSTYSENYDAGVCSSDSGDSPYQTSDLNTLKSAVNTAQDALRTWKNITPSDLHKIWPIPTTVLAAGEEDEQQQQQQSSRNSSSSFRQATTIVQDCLIDLGLEVYYQPAEVAMWLEKAFLAVTQAWSQLVRNDTTFELVTNFGISWIIHRHRNNQTATFSPFFLADDPNLLLYLAGFIHEAHNDAIDRLKLNNAKVDSGAAASHGDPNTPLHCTDGDEDNSDEDQDATLKRSRRKANSFKLRKSGRSEGMVEGGDSDNHGDPLFNIQELHFAFHTDPYFTDGYIILTRVPNLSPVVPATSQMPEMVPFTGFSHHVGNSATSSSEPSCLSNSETHSTALTSPQASLSKETSTVDHAAIIITTLSSNGTIGHIGTGHLTTENDGSYDVVVKLAGDREDKEKLVIEAEFYAKLQSHSMAEWYLGLFHEEGAEEGISGLVMKNLGVPITSFQTLSKKQKKSLYNCVLKIHSAHIKHNDLNPRNVVMDQDSNVYVIDYHLAEVHECPGEDICDELLDLLDGMKI